MKADPPQAVKTVRASEAPPGPKLAKACLQVVRCAHWLGHRQVIHNPSNSADVNHSKDLNGSSRQQSIQANHLKKKIPPPVPNRVFLLLIGEAHFRWGQARAFLFFGLGPNPFQVGTPHRSRSINDSVQGRPANPSDFSSGTVLTNQVPTRPARQHHRQATISKDYVPTPEARHELCFAVLCLSALLSLHDIGMGLCLVLL